MFALQWGRNFIVAETSRPGRNPQTRRTRFNGAATLSLRKPINASLFAVKYCSLQWGRNFIVAETRPSRNIAAKQFSASMGPQLYRCGNLCADLVPQVRRGALQWGRNFIVAETWDVSRAPMLVLRLQWGRNFIVAETRLPWHDIRHECVRFNGAATLSLRKLCTWWAAMSHSLASMGPQLYRCVVSFTT